MNTEMLSKIMTNNDWGTHMADGDNFYRMLFRLERKSNLTIDDVKQLFASYKNWKKRVNQLTAECHSNSTMEDRKAIQYSETLDEDIVKHIEAILAAVKCDDPTFLPQLIAKEEEAAKMNE